MVFGVTLAYFRLARWACFCAPFFGWMAIVLIDPFYNCLIAALGFVFEAVVGACVMQTIRCWRRAELLVDFVLSHGWPWACVSCSYSSSKA